MVTYGLDDGENQSHTTDGISLEFGWREHGGSECERKGTRVNNNCKGEKSKVSLYRRCRPDKTSLGNTGVKRKGVGWGGSLRDKF